MTSDRTSFFIGTAIVISKDSNLKRPEREAEQSGGLFCSDGVKPTVRGGVDRRMRSIRINPATLAKAFEDSYQFDTNLRSY